METDPGAFNQVGELLSGLSTQQSKFYDDQREQWQRQARKERLNGMCAGLTTCDGEVSTQTRNYLYDVQLLSPALANDHAGVIHIHSKTTAGPLRREIQRYLEVQPEGRDQVPWARIRAHVERSFLSSDEQEKLRLHVEQIVQREGETLASYNRRYREASERAYPGLRSADGERLVLRHYLKGLRSTELAKKVSLELPQQTLVAALTFVEQIETGLERYAGLNREDDRNVQPMDTSAVQLAPALGELAAALKQLQKGQERLMTRVGKLEPNQQTRQQGPRPGTGSLDASGTVACFICGGPHFKVGCPRRSARPRGSAPTGDRQRPNQEN